MRKTLALAAVAALALAVFGVSPAAAATGARGGNACLPWQGSLAGSFDAVSQLLKGGVAGKEGWYKHDVVPDDVMKEAPAATGLARTSGTIEVYFHVINKGTGSRTATSRTRRSPPRSTSSTPPTRRPAGRSISSPPTGRRTPPGTRWARARRPRRRRRPRCARAPPTTSTSTRRTSAAACSAGRRSRRATRPARRYDGVVILYSSVPGGSAAAVQRWATPRRTRSATGWACTTRSRAAANGTGDLVDDTPAERSAGLRLPDRPRHLPRQAGGRARPDHELHGLHGRLLHERVHGGPGRPDGRAVHGVSRRQVAAHARRRVRRSTGSRRRLHWPPRARSSGDRARASGARSRRFESCRAHRRAGAAVAGTVSR